MKIPKEFEDVFRGVDLTEGEIRTLTWIAGWESRTVKNLRSAIQKAQDAALSALRPVSREQVEKVWRGEWTPGDSICPICEKNKFDGLDADIWADWMPSFCPNCGAPMTDEAVEMVMERLEALHDKDVRL